MKNLKIEDFDIVELYEETDVGFFYSGNQHIDWWLKGFSKHYQSEGKIKTTVFYLDGKLVGYCSLLTDKVLNSHSTKLLDKFPSAGYIDYFPCVYIYAIGVEFEHQNNGIGSIIMEWIIDQVKYIRQWLGIRFLVLWSFKDEKLLRFYDKYEFKQWEYIEEDENGELIPLIFDYL